MNTISKIKSILLLFVTSAFIFSCSSDTNDEIQGGSNETNFELIVNPTNGSNTAERDLKITTTSLNASEKVNVTFTAAAGNSMKRLYIAKSENGGEIVPFTFTQTADTKADGSIDLAGNDSETFTFNIDFDTPTTADGTITYIIWATTGRGDFRDVAKRNAIGDFDFGTITITAGNGAVGNGVKSFTQTILNAPLGDGSSDTFMSVLDGEIYKISEGEELASFWDFGYYYGQNDKASLASTASYPKLFDHDNNAETPLEAVSVLTGVDQQELNNFYMTKTTTVDFDAITNREDLDEFVILDPKEVVTELAIGDVIAFEDNYGNKGLIRVSAIEPGFGSNDGITIDVKVQTSEIFRP